jgi:hypothetical protein
MRRKSIAIYTFQNWDYCSKKIILNHLFSVYLHYIGDWTSGPGFQSRIFRRRQVEELARKRNILTTCFTCNLLSPSRQAPNNTLKLATTVFTLTTSSFTKQRITRS